MSGTCRASAGVSPRISSSLNRKVAALEADLFADVGGKVAYACVVVTGATEPIWRTKTAGPAEAERNLAGLHGTVLQLAESLGATGVPSIVLKGNSHILACFELSGLVFALMATIPVANMPRVESFILVDKARRHVDELGLLLTNVG